MIYTNAPVETNEKRGKAINESTVQITYTNPKAKSWSKGFSGYQSDNNGMGSRRRRVSDVVKLSSIIKEDNSRKGKTYPIHVFMYITIRGLQDQIRNWRIHGKENLSDHKTILFDVVTNRQLTDRRIHT